MGGEIDGVGRMRDGVDGGGGVGSVGQIQRKSGGSVQGCEVGVFCGLSGI